VTFPNAGAGMPQGFRSRRLIRLSRKQRHVPIPEQMREELESRLRANKQRRRSELGLPLRRNFLLRFEQATGSRIREDEFLSVSDSDELVGMAIQRASSMRPDAVWHTPTALVYGGLSSFAPSVGEARYYLHCAGCDVMGMPLVPLAPLLRSIEAFWLPGAEDLILTSTAAEDGLMLEWCDHWIELRMWGWLGDLLRG
jgi:hypothetical protein